MMIHLPYESSMANTNWLNQISHLLSKSAILFWLCGCNRQTFSQPTLQKHRLLLLSLSLLSLLLQSLLLVTITTVTITTVTIYTVTIITGTITFVTITTVTISTVTVTTITENALKITSVLLAQVLRDSPINHSTTNVDIINWVPRPTSTIIYRTQSQQTGDQKWDHDSDLLSKIVRNGMAELSNLCALQYTDLYMLETLLGLVSGFTNYYLWMGCLP